MLAILPTLTEDGIEFSVIAPPVGPLAEAFEQLAIPLTPLYSLNSAGEKKSQVEMRESLASSISEIKPDVVHANSLAMGRMVGPVCQQLGIASISHLRDIIKLSKQAIADLNCNTRLVAVSHAVRDHHVAAGLSSEKTEVLYNGVDLDVFQPRSPTGFLHRELKIPPQSQLIAIIGQICLRKGLDVFAEAARLLAQSNDDLHFIVIGSRFSQKQESCELEQRLIDLSLGELHGKLHLLGERTDVHQILNEITVLIHASRQEPLGRVLLEASAARATRRGDRCWRHSRNFSSRVGCSKNRCGRQRPTNRRRSDRPDRKPPNANSNKPKCKNQRRKPFFLSYRSIRHVSNL